MGADKEVPLLTAGAAAALSLVCREGSDLQQQCDAIAEGRAQVCIVPTQGELFADLCAAGILLPTTQFYRLAGVLAQYGFKVKEL